MSQRDVMDAYRCLRPGGSLLLGFFEGARVPPFAHAVVTAYFWPVPAMQPLLAAAGFDVMETNARTDPGHRPHAAVLARRQPPIGDPGFHRTTKPGR